MQMRSAVVAYTGESRGLAMAERRETVVYRYVGHCPECGAEQEGRTVLKADGVCDLCRGKKAFEKFEAKLTFLKDAKILGFKGECSANLSDGSTNWCGISELTVKTKDGRTINVTTSRGLWREMET